MMAMRGTQEGPTDRKDAVQSQAGPDKARTDTDQSTIKSGPGDTATSTNGSSSGIPVSQRSSGEDRASDGLAGTSPPSTIARQPVILRPTEDSSVRLREPLLED